MAFKRLDVPFPKDKYLEQWWAELQRRLAEAFGGADSAGLESVLFVSKDGDDATAQRSSLNFKFKTISAAITASLPFDTILAGPGTYVERLTLPPYALVIAALSPDTVQLAHDDLVDAPLVQYVGALAVPFHYFKSIAMSAGGANPATPMIQLHPSAAVNYNAVFDKCNITRQAAGAAIHAQRCVSTVIDECSVKGDVSSENSGALRTTEGAITGDVDVTYDTTAPTPSGGSQVSLLMRTTITGDVNQHLQARMQLVDAMVTGAVTENMSETTERGSLDVEGGSVGSVSVLAGGAPPPAAAEFFSMRRATVHGALVASGAAALPNRQTADVRGCVLLGAVTADDCDLDIRGSTYDDAALAFVASGTVDRDTVRFSGQAGAGPGGAAVVFSPPAPPLPAGVAYKAMATSIVDNQFVSVIGPNTTTQVVASGNTGGGAGAATNADFVLTRS